MSHEALRQEASCRFAIPVAVSTFFLIRYQTVIASSRETNFARQFSSVSLVHRMETNIERQFFEVCSFIFAVQQNLPDE